MKKMYWKAHILVIQNTMKSINMIKRVSYKLFCGTKHFNDCTVSLAVLVMLSALLFIYMFQYIQLAANHIIFSSTHNLTNGCLLGTEKCQNSAIGPNSRPPSDIFFPNGGIDIACFDSDDFLNGGCYAVGLANFIIIIIIAAIVSGLCFVCLTVLMEIYYFCFAAKQIYEEELSLREIKVY